MCPDAQLLSVYSDGELPSPWKEKMESHLAQCPLCRHRLEVYGLLSGSDREKAAAAAAEAATRERVWKKIEEKTGIGAAASEVAAPASVPYEHPYQLYARPGFWGRRVSIPLPAAAAAVLLIIAAAALWAVRNGENMTVTSEYALWPSAIEAGFDSPGIYPAADLNDVLQYLDSRDSGDIVILRLPETRSFMSSGEPIIKAAGYSRRKP